MKFSKTMLEFVEFANSRIRFEYVCGDAINGYGRLGSWNITAEIFTNECRKCGLSELCEGATYNTWAGNGRVLRDGRKPGEPDDTLHRHSWDRNKPVLVAKFDAFTGMGRVADLSKIIAAIDDQISTFLTTGAPDPVLAQPFGVNQNIRRYSW